MKTGPSLLDRGFQLAYIVAHRLLRVYWALRGRHTRGSLAALWNNGELLVVKNSYRVQWTLPGGYRHSHESPTEAAARELREECGIVLAAEALHLAYEGIHRYEGRRDEVAICECQLDAPVTIAVDHREVVEAKFCSREELQKLPLVPHLIDYLAMR